MSEAKEAYNVAVGNVADGQPTGCCAATPVACECRGTRDGPHAHVSVVLLDFVPGAGRLRSTQYAVVELSLDGWPHVVECRLCGARYEVAVPV
jgi:hypothetical protein